MENTNNNSSVEHNEDSIDLKALFFKILRKWYWFVIAVLICAAIAIFYAIRTPYQYEGQTSIILRDDKSGSFFSQLSLIDGLSSLGGLGGGTSRQLEDEIQTMTSLTLMSEMIKSLNIETEYFEKKGIKKEVELYPTSPVLLITPEAFNDTLQKTVVFNIEAEKDGYKIIFSCGNIKEHHTVQDLSRSINTQYGIFKFKENKLLDKDSKYKIVSYPRQALAEQYILDINIATANKRTNVLNLSMTNTNKEKMKVVLNSIVNLYTDEVIKDKNILSDYTAKYINHQIEITKQELADLEVEVEQYKKANNIISINAEATISLEAVKQYEKELLQIETQISIISYIDELVKNKDNQYNLIPASLGGIQEQALLLLINSYNENLLKRNRLLRTTNEQNPVIIELDNQLSSLRSNISLSIGSVIEGLNVAKENLLKKDTELADRMKTVPTMERQFLEIKRMQEVKQTMYLFLLQKQYENELTNEATVPPVRVIDAAYVSLEPVAPRRMIILAIAVLLGIIIPFIIIVALDFLNNKISGERELASKIRPKYLGKIQKNKSSGFLLAQNSKEKENIALFKAIRSNIRFMLHDIESPVLLVTSSIEGEGKSFIAANLASQFAQQGKKTVLLELNIQNPSLANYFNIPGTSKGVADFLTSSEIKIQDIIMNWSENSNLAIIHAGNLSIASDELLYSQQLDNMIVELKKEFDYIIIDSADISNSPDTYILNRFVDSTVYVSRMNYTPQKYIDLINSTYESNKLNNMCVILNGVEKI